MFEIQMSQEVSHNQSHNIQEDPKPLDKSVIEDIIRNSGCITTNN